MTSWKLRLATGLSRLQLQLLASPIARHASSSWCGRPGYPRPRGCYFTAGRAALPDRGGIRGAHGWHSGRSGRSGHLGPSSPHTCPGETANGREGRTPPRLHTKSGQAGHRARGSRSPGQSLVLPVTPPWARAATTAAVSDLVWVRARDPADAQRCSLNRMATGHMFDKSKLRLAHQHGDGSVCDNIILQSPWPG